MTGIQYKQRVPRQITRMVRRIVREFHPERVILFGSHARGEAGPDSDVDLLVVMPVEGSRREKQVDIRVALHDLHVPKDVIVTTPEDFEWRKEVPGTIEYPAASEGKVLQPCRERETIVGTGLGNVEWVHYGQENRRS
jgi:predicted nucleotidyltransferase